MPSPSIQDMPPDGGFRQTVPYKRHLPSRGPPGWVWLSAMATCIGTGFYLHSRGLRIRIELEREKRQARFALMPLMLAEQDRRDVVERTRRLVAESQAMKDIPGWIVGQSVYKTDTKATRTAHPLNI